MQHIQIIDCNSGQLGKNIINLRKCRRPKGGGGGVSQKRTHADTGV